MPYYKTMKDTPLPTVEDINPYTNQKYTKKEIYDFYLVLVKIDGLSLKNVPDEFKTPDLCSAAVNNSSLSLEFVPEHLKTKEICLNAVNKDGGALLFVPHVLKGELYLIAIQNGASLSDVPIDQRDEKISETAVRNHPYDLEFVPEDLKTKEICMLAVSNHGSLLEIVPEHLKTKEICLEAVNNDVNALEFVPDELKDTVIKAVSEPRQRHNSLESVPSGTCKGDGCTLMGGKKSKRKRKNKSKKKRYTFCFKH